MDATQYTKLVTSEHSSKPNFMAFVAALVQTFVDQQKLLASFSALFDVDLAVGDQLDKIGAWAGVSRNLSKVIGGVTVLDDATYRVLIKFNIAMNIWDGTVPGIYTVWWRRTAGIDHGRVLHDAPCRSSFECQLFRPKHSGYSYIRAGSGRCDCFRSGCRVLGDYRSLKA